tara:strand:+ start:7672 stop:9003 length:1332 start_codon:yes stop_codon:yes gene_type:complete
LTSFGFCGVSEKMNITLDPWQEKFLRTTGDKLLCTGRQVGKSVICGMDAGQYALDNPKKVILMIAPTERQAYALFEKTLDHIYRTDKKQIKKGKYRPTKSKINLKNGTIIWCLPTGLTGLGIRFLTVHRLYADEASRIPEMVWDAVTPMMLTTGGDTILLSTPFGCQGYYYDALINKDNAFNTYTRFRTDSEKVMRERVICETWTTFQRDKALQRLEAEKARMTTLAYAQEYMGQPLNDLKQVFPDKLLKQVMCLQRPSHIQAKRQYFLGQDIAGMGRDLSTWEILDGTDKQKIRQMESITKRHTQTPERVNLTDSLEQKYNFKKIGIDDGGIGSGDFGYLLINPSTRRKVISLNNASRDIERDGSRRKKLLKEDMYTNLLAMMEHKQIKLLTDEDIFHSLRSVQFETERGKTRFYGNDTHIAEGLIRAAWLVRTKPLNIYLY